jgi:hypothetical protein
MNAMNHRFAKYHCGKNYEHKNQEDKKDQKDQKDQVDSEDQDNPEITESSHHRIKILKINLHDMLSIIYYQYTINKNKMDNEKFLNMIDRAMTCFERNDDPDQILADFCLTCGLHGDCNNLTCMMKHCRGKIIPCTQDDCCCDKTKMSQCQYTDILNGTEKRYMGRHIMRLSPGITEWCISCHSHLDCGFEECVHDHCVCSH